MEQPTENVKIIYIYKSITSEAQKQANKKYYNSNKDKVLEYQKAYKRALYEQDADYRAKIQQKTRERYLKKKQEKEQMNQQTSQILSN